MSQSEKEPEEKIGFSGLQPVQMFPVWITGFTEWFKEYEDDDASIVLFCVCVCMIFFTFFFFLLHSKMAHVNCCASQCILCPLMSYSDWLISK